MERTITFEPNTLGVAAIIGVIGLATGLPIFAASRIEKKARTAYNEAANDIFERDFATETREATLQNGKLNPEDRAYAFKILSAAMPKRTTSPGSSSITNLKNAVDAFDKLIGIFATCDEETISAFLKQHKSDDEKAEARRIEKEKLNAQKENAQTIADAIKYDADAKRKAVADERKYELDKFGMIADTVISVANGGKDKDE